MIFDCKLNWSTHIASCINKAKKALFALRLLKKYFSLLEMGTLLDSYFYSVLYYNSVIWLQPEINSIMKQKLLSISACALRSCLILTVLFPLKKSKNITKKSTPSQIMAYQASLKLYKTLNFDLPSFETITVLDQMPFSSRQTMFLIFRINATKIGMNTTANKFYQLSNKIPLSSLSLSFVHYKKLMKLLFLKYGKT